MVTIKDIAKELGVSISTVSKGLNGGSDISDSLRAIILDKAVEMGYTSRKAKKMENRTFAIFLEKMAYEKPEDFAYNIVLGLRQAAFRDHWDVKIFHITPEFQTQHPLQSLMLEKGYSGACLLGLTLDDPWMKEMDAVHVPVTMLDNYIPGNPSVSCVETDSGEALELVISHLIGLGHEKIAFLDGEPHSYISDRRMKAYLNSMRRHHLPVDPNMAVYADYHEEAAVHNVPGMLDLGATAIVCASDLLAKGAIECCKSLGYRVPEDVSIVGYDDIPAAAAIDPPLTTIRQDTAAIGRCFFYILVSAVDSTTISHCYLRPGLVVRNSTGPAGPRLVTRRIENKNSVLYVNPTLYMQQN